MPSTTIGTLITGLPLSASPATVALAVHGVTDDSRHVGRGDLFVARRGAATDGRRFAAEAMSRGAVAVVTDDAAGLPHGTPLVIPASGADLAAISAELAERACGRPSGRLALVGVTGTNGKTTTAWLIHQILQRSGLRCGLIGTVAVDDGRRRLAASLTTPAAPQLSRLLAAMVEHRCRAAVMEASSHALDQGRVAALQFEGAIFTNLSGDHLDYHGTLERYAAAKRRLFEMLGPGQWAVINADDSQADAMTAGCRAEVLRCSTRPRGAPCTAQLHRADLSGMIATLRGPWGTQRLRLPLVGRHNLVNALQAAAAAHRLGVDGRSIAAALEAAEAPPGRLEPVNAPGEPAVLVDYAHTDDALENVLSALRPLVQPPARLRVVFGCGGDRDRTKRPRMAAAAWRYADEVIVTSDNPRTEDPEAIIAEIMTGVPDKRRAATITFADRAAAIDLAVRRSAPGDLLLIAGKGHENEQIIGDQRRPFDDRRVARAALARRRCSDVEASSRRSGVVA